MPKTYGAVRGFLLGTVVMVLPFTVSAMGLDNPTIPFNALAIGMGEAIVADGTQFNAAAFNPALLANAPHFGEVSFGLGISNDIFSMANYLTNTDNLNSLEDSLKGTGAGIQNITQGLAQPTPDVARVNQGIGALQSAITNLQKAATALTDRTIQLGAGLNIAMKFDDHWGFQVYNSTHAVFQITQGSIVKDVEKITSLPTLQNSSPAATAQAVSQFWGQMGSIFQTAFNSQGVSLGQAVTNLENDQTSHGVTQFSQSASDIFSSSPSNSLQQALFNDFALVTSLAYTDTVAMATYSMKPLDEGTPFTVGANLKVVNRRIGYVTSKWLSDNVDQLSDITTPLRNDIGQSTLRWGLDLGVLYELEEEKISLGLSAQDLVRSTATINTDPGDPLYGVVTDPAPTVVRFGTSWHPIRSFTVEGDIDDIFSGTSFYQGLGFGSHLKLGMGYDLMGMFQLRGGLSDSNLSGGIGLPFLGINYAYAMDDLSQSYNHYIQFESRF